MDKWVIKDRDDYLRPWHRLVCYFRGHDWKAKMRDQVCRRCQTSKRYM
jgi:hypothetical protein